MGQNHAACLQVSGLSRTVCIEFPVPEYHITLENVFKKGS